MQRKAALDADPALKKAASRAEYEKDLAAKRAVSQAAYKRIQLLKGLHHVQLMRKSLRQQEL